MSNEPHEPNKRTRASGELLDYLLMEFDNNPNPSNEAKKAISEKTGLPEKSVRIWFQNRRAKARKLEKRGSVDSTKRTRGSNASDDAGHFLALNELPVQVNDSYCFIECSTLSVGNWQRVKSGFISPSALALLMNLSPLVLTDVLERCDLLILLSRKNHEINYFFSSFFENKKILFRIFYPIASVINSSLLENQTEGEYVTTELRLSLNAPPKFCVYFSNNDTNKWCICEDFSENQQVKNAYNGGNGTGDPHALVGSKNALQFLSAYIIEHNNNQQLQHPNNLNIKLDGYEAPFDASAYMESPMGMPAKMPVMDFAQFQIETRDSPAMRYTNEYEARQKHALNIHSPGNLEDIPNLEDNLPLDNLPLNLDNSQNLDNLPLTLSLPQNVEDPLMMDDFNDGDDFITERAGLNPHPYTQAYGYDQNFTFTLTNDNTTISTPVSHPTVPITTGHSGLGAETDFAFVLDDKPEMYPENYLAKELKEFEAKDENDMLMSEEDGILGEFVGPADDDMMKDDVDEWF
ncbi:hypothetical protein BABINDRAFT_166427 [Babjeviella inositovora NRRL Y-12698]|uniref:Homeobox domain-containing protein n=1 Tax=Babjeviella inositovora NRRL Y-12698 TaxID=984486 RepID=A0A1E3QUY5_9ASCO|nr:uncharacterized protein BABINDRAFT_166427 [Babjeviella inositovora NRRL Y-12698]ODQ80852.1 hypothetical protein BABINDRAFT_166427 [Babjeviella inositovora NRRL Y-12698]